MNQLHYAGNFPVFFLLFILDIRQYYWNSNLDQGCKPGYEATSMLRNARSIRAQCIHVLLRIQNYIPRNSQHGKERSLPNFGMHPNQRHLWQTNGCILILNLQQHLNKIIYIEKRKKHCEQLHQALARLNALSTQFCFLKSHDHYDEFLVGRTGKSFFFFAAYNS